MPLSPFVTPPLFHCRLKTRRFHKSFPPQSVFFAPDCIHCIQTVCVGPDIRRCLVFIISSSPDCRQKYYVFGLSVRRVRSSGQMSLPRYLTNGLSSLDETYGEYSLAHSDDPTRFWRSKVKVTARLSVWWRRNRRRWSFEVHLLSSTV